MSSNIKVQRICQWCGIEFTARTTSTRYCSHRCNSLAYKAGIKDRKIETSDKETLHTRLKPIDEIKSKEFLTVKDASILINCSVRTTYRLIEQGRLKAVNLSTRKTLIRRSDIDGLFTDPEEPEQSAVPISDNSEIRNWTHEGIIDIEASYTKEDILSIFHISVKDLDRLINQNDIPAIKKGWDIYYPKTLINNLFNKENVHKS